MTQSTDDNIAAAATPGNSQTYAYDNLDHLTQYYLNTTIRQNYSYDLDGNRTRRTADGNSVDYNYPANSNQLIAASGKTYSHDAAGHVISDGLNQYRYNNSGRLTQAVNSRGRTFYYFNGLGRRVGKWVSKPLDLAGDADHDGQLTVLDFLKIVIMVQGQIPIDLAADCNRDNTITLADLNCSMAKLAAFRLNPGKYQLTLSHYVYDVAGHLTGEYRQNGTPIQETVYLGDTPVLILMPGATPKIYTIDTDHLDTPRVIKNNAGTVVWRWDHAEPFGATQPNQNPGGLGTFTYNLRFPGQYYDQETGLHYNMERFYDPATGRYFQSDPIGLAGGINTYAYVGGNPLSRIDPLGLDGKSAAKWAFNQNGNSNYQWWDSHPESHGWLPDMASGRFANKCNAFVWDGLSAGGDPPGRMPDGRIPTTAEWEDEKVPGYHRVFSKKPRQLGDVVVDEGHMGVYYPLPDGNPGTFRASGKLPWPEVVHNDWGFRQGQTPSFFRCDCDIR